VRLDPKIVTDTTGVLWLTWTVDSAAIAYDIIAPGGQHVQAGRKASRARLGKPTLPVKVSIAAAHSGAYESVLYAGEGGGGGTPTPAVFPRYGIATGFPIMDSGTPLSTVDFELDECQAIGADYIRCDLLENAAFEDRFDYVLSGCESRSLKVLPCLRGTSGPYGATNAVNFAKAMWTRFGARSGLFHAITYVNEPNLFPHTAPRYTPTQYATEFAAVSDALHGIDSTILVGGAAMGYDGAGSFSGWWPGFMSHGGAGKYDFWDIHLYNDPSSANFDEAFALNFEGKPVVATEAGSNSGSMSTRQSVITNVMHDSRLASVCVYSMRNFGDNFGLLDSSNVRRASWDTYHDIATA
jgi:hypothetical protein